MKKTKQMGIWMDHSVANLMELANNRIITNVITSEFTHEVKEYALSKNENLMHNKEQHEQAGYYDKISDAIKGYDEILLFGPTTAKNELLNLLKTDHHFDKVKVDVISTDKMTENQQHAFIKDHFQFQ